MNDAQVWLISIVAGVAVGFVGGVVAHLVLPGGTLNNTDTNPDGIKLGDRVKDRISGLRGIVVGFYTFLYGCERVAIQPEECKDGKPVEGYTCDAAQCELIDRSAVRGYEPPSPQAVRPAGPRADPAPRTTPSR